MKEKREAKNSLYCQCHLRRMGKCTVSISAQSECSAKGRNAYAVASWILVSYQNYCKSEKTPIKQIKINVD